MVVGYERDYFGAEIIPELVRLSKSNIIRVVDLIFVNRDAESVVTSHEMAQVLPQHASLIANPEWFTQDDIDVVGETLPDDSSVALLLLEHRWATKLDGAVHYANSFLGNAEVPAESRSIEIEQLLATGAGVNVSRIGAQECPYCD
jgi:hypothetical protein